jgi:hypothetical protein
MDEVQWFEEGPALTQEELQKPLQQRQKVHMAAPEKRHPGVLIRALLVVRVCSLMLELSFVWIWDGNTTYPFPSSPQLLLLGFSMLAAHMSLCLVRVWQ